MADFDHSRAIPSKSGLCEWDPVTDSYAMTLRDKYVGCGAPHAVVVGCGKNSLLLCEKCAALPIFSRRRKRFITPRMFFREAIQAIIGKPCPVKTPIISLSELNDDETMALQDWCSNNANPLWATGLSMMEAAELIVKSALENANITEDGRHRFG